MRNTEQLGKNLLANILIGVAMFYFFSFALGEYLSGFVRSFIIRIYPDFICEYSANYRPNNIESGSEFFLGHVSRIVNVPDGLHLIPREFSHVAPLSSKHSEIVRLPSFTHHVVHVVLVNTHPKVRGINTMPDIALMADKHAFWNEAEMNQPTCPVSKNGSGFLSSAASFSHAAVTVRHDVSSPEPAGIGVVDLGKESSQESVRRALRSDVIGDRFDLHNESFSLCHALDGSNRARAFLFSHMEYESAT